MTLKELDILLSHPHQIGEHDNEQLKQILQKYPYFQSVRSLYLKSLYIQNSTSYNQELKKAAAHTLDRDILFDFIISSDFITYTPITTNEVEVNPITPEPKLTSTAIKSLLQSITIHEKEEVEITTTYPPSSSIKKVEDIDKHTDNTDTSNIQESISPILTDVEQLEDKLEIGKPLNFTVNEKLSFQEWLQLSKINPIDRENDSILTKTEQITDIEKQKKIELIDKFIETNPKIVPTKKATVTPINIDSSVQENSSLMTETLAKIYLEQKKYQKAIQAYEILILKYPEKSSFFANQILDIKALQQHNS